MKKLIEKQGLGNVDLNYNFIPYNPFIKYYLKSNIKK